MTTELSLTTERIDDFPLLLAPMQRLGLPAVLDRHLTRHGLQQGLSWGWIATIWLAHILSQGDHRKLPVQAWVRQAGETILRITGLAELTEWDFTDDRLAIVLHRLSHPAVWAAIETELGRNILRVYDLTPACVRLDRTTVSGAHAGGADGLFQFGHSKDDPTLGWRAYVTNAPAAQLTLADAVLTYRDEWLIERGFHRLKGAPLSLDPLFVKRDDQVMGLINLLSIAVRLLTLIEFVVRRQLKQNQEQLVGLIENNPKKGIDNPTTERLLKTCDDVTLTIVRLPGQIIRHVTPLSALQTRILELLGLSPGVYLKLSEN